MYDLNLGIKKVIKFDKSKEFKKFQIFLNTIVKKKN